MSPQLRTMSALVVLRPSLTGQQQRTFPSNRLLNHLVRAQQKQLRDGEPQCLGGLEVDNELELTRVLDGQIARLGAL